MSVDSNHWERWTVLCYRKGAGLERLIEAGAPTQACTRDGLPFAECRAATPEDPAALTLCWCALILRAWVSDPRQESAWEQNRRFGALRVFVRDDELRDALLAALYCGGPDAGKAFVRGVRP